MRRMLAMVSIFLDRYTVLMCRKISYPITGYRRRTFLLLLLHKITFLPTFLLKYIIGDMADNGIIKYKDTKAKCRHLKNWPVKWLCGRCLSVLGPEPHTPPPQVNSFRWRHFALPYMSLIFLRFLLWHKVTLLLHYMGQRGPVQCPITLYTLGERSNRI